jgi:hypothetical protein
MNKDSEYERNLEHLEKLIRSLPPAAVAKLMALPGVREKYREMQKEAGDDRAE